MSLERRALSLHSQCAAKIGKFTDEAAVLIRPHREICSALSHIIHPVTFSFMHYVFFFFFFVLCIISSILHSSDNTVLFVAYGLILLLLWLLMKNIRWKTWEMRISNENIHKTLYMLYKWWYTLYMNIVSKCLNKTKQQQQHNNK